MAFPKIDACIVCEGVREEVHKKHILFGFFGITPYVKVGIQDIKLPVTLAFVFCGGAGEGRFHLELQVTDLSGATVPNKMSASLDGEVMRGLTTTSVFFAFQGIVPGYGNYKANLLIDGKLHYSSSFTIGPFQ